MGDFGRVRVPVSRDANVGDRAMNKNGVRFVGLFFLIVAILLLGIDVGIRLPAKAVAIQQAASAPLLHVADPYTVFYANHGDWIQVFLIIPSTTKSEDDTNMFADFKQQLANIGKPAVVGVCTQVDTDIYNCIPDYGTIYVTTHP